MKGLAIFASLAGAGITLFLVWKLQKYRGTEKYQQGTSPFIKLLHWEERLVQKAQERIKGLASGKGNHLPTKQIIFEILLLGVWAFWVGRTYLDLDMNIIPNGREFSSAIQTHHLWTRFADCGLCALWNGSVRGGYPAFADVHGSMLHPLVILTTATFGVLNGAKISLILSLWVGGIAQWWIGKELNLSRIPRLWAGGMAIVAGHLTGRMELGAFGVVLSTAMASLVFGGILAVSRGKGNKAIVLLGAGLASALLAGQGYIQVGLLMSIPAILILVLDKKLKLQNTWKQFLIAFILAGLLAAVFLVPFLRFSPNFVKYMDGEFSAAQPFKYIPLNYVIDSYDFYQSEALDKLPFPHLYVLFIGWIPVLFAAFGLWSKRISQSIRWYFIISILIILGVSSGDLLKLIGKIWEGVGGIRHPTQIAGLTIPLILGFAGAGLEDILDLDWPKIDLKFENPNRVEVQSIPSRLLMIIPLIFSLSKGYQFTKHWVGVHKQSSEIIEVLEELKTDTLQWVQPPYGEHFYVEPAIRMGLKLSSGTMTFQWKDRAFPKAQLEASHSGQPDGTGGIKAIINTIVIYVQPDTEYAFVMDESQKIPCEASGNGGNINVVCNSTFNGRLVVQENYEPGWKGWMDGKPMALFGDPWISTDVPKGYHTFEFRYRPWDVPLGLLLTVVGLILSVAIWRSPVLVTERDYTWSIKKPSDPDKPKTS